ncbi:MAG: hypothetical protein H6510_14690 [Acidobacteria bacterium]|nr:hypothetical protein [Acidobacteriota bacterium]MCB9399059.1 hypothetical protein [Acidobacteriota bacterium]
MIPIGYMYKKVSAKTDWLKAPQVKEICSVSSCISQDFADWINYWAHNGYWMFNAPQVIESLAMEQNIVLAGHRLFYYEAFEKQWDEEPGVWVHFEPESSFETAVKAPLNALLLGFDIVSFFAQNGPECSPLSCNHLADTIEVNEHCLIPTFNEAKRLLEAGAFKNSEPGPYRIIAVHAVQNT